MTVPAIFTQGFDPSGNVCILVVNATDGSIINVLSDPSFNDVGNTIARMQYDPNVNALYVLNSNNADPFVIHVFTDPGGTAIHSVVSYPDDTSGQYVPTFLEVSDFAERWSNQDGFLADFTNQNAITTDRFFLGVIKTNMTTGGINSVIPLVDTNGIADAAKFVSYDNSNNHLWAIGSNTVNVPSAFGTGAADTIYCIDPDTDVTVLKFNGAPSTNPYWIMYDPAHNRTYIAQNDERPSDLVVWRIDTSTSPPTLIDNVVISGTNFSSSVPYSVDAAGNWMFGPRIYSSVDGSIIADMSADLPGILGGWWDTINLRYVYINTNAIFTADATTFAVSTLASYPGDGVQEFSIFYPTLSVSAHATVLTTNISCLSTLVLPVAARVGGISTIQKAPIGGKLTPNHGTVDGGTLVVATPIDGTWDSYKTLDTLSPYVGAWWTPSGTINTTLGGTSMIDTNSESTLRFNDAYTIGNFSALLQSWTISGTIDTNDLIVGSFGLYIDNGNFIRIEIFTNRNIPISARLVISVGGIIETTAPVLVSSSPLTCHIIRVNASVQASVGTYNFPLVPGWVMTPAHVELRTKSAGSVAVSTIFTRYTNTPMLLSNSIIIGNMTGDIIPPAIQFIMRRGVLATSIPISIHLPTIDISIGNWAYDDDGSLILANDGGQVLSVIGDHTLRQ